jgi:hypothetical protein
MTYHINLLYISLYKLSHQYIGNVFTGKEARPGFIHRMASVRQEKDQEVNGKSQICLF